MKNGTPLWREAHLQVKMYKTPHGRSHFGRCDLEKWHAAVARSTFVSQNAQNTSCSEPLWTLQSGKMARRCGAKHICKSKCTKRLSFRHILQEPICKKWHAAVARSTFVSQNAEKTNGLGPLLDVPMSASQLVN